MEAWLAAAVAAVPRWIEFQMRATQQAGCIIAIAHRGALVLEAAFGAADLSTGEALTPRHRFRAASHTKSVTAAGILKLREAGRLRLDDPIGQHLPGLHPEAAAATIAQLLSHSAGLTRDGGDSGQFADRRPFLDTAEVLADLAEAPPIPAGSRFKYSNHGYALLGLLIERLTGEAWAGWIGREVIAAAGLAETLPDAPLPPGTPFARGHTGRLLLGERRVIPGDMPTHGIAPAAGLVTTAADLVRFFGQLSPEAPDSLLSPASRREMTRRHWRVPMQAMEGSYGLGTMDGNLGGWEWFGHTGGLQGYISRTSVVPEQELAVSVLVNGLDGLAGPWNDGILHLLKGFAERGAPEPGLADWTGRWWTLWGAFDLLPMGNRVFVTSPGTWNPLLDAAEVEVTGPDEGRVVQATGYASHGEAVRLRRGGDGRVTEVWLGGGLGLPEAVAQAEIATRYPGRYPGRAATAAG
jgi:CubicO group peptidase (beta-lactamase class C family)